MSSWWARLRATLRFETIADEVISQRPSRALLSALGGVPSASGVHVTAQAVLGIPEVEACHRVIAQGVARCPLKVRVRDEKGGWVDAYESPLWEILHDLPNPEQTAAAFRTQLTRDLLAHERAYAQIIRKPNGQVLSLWRLDPKRMTVDRDASNRKRYTYRLVDGSEQVFLFDADRPPILDLEYISPVHRCRELFGLALAVEQYAALFFGNGARLSGLLSTDQPKLDEATIKQLQEKFSALNTGLVNAHKVAVVTGGLKFQPLSAPNDEAQLLELRRFLGQRICGVYGVPPHKIADLERATFSNIEHQDREFVSSTLDPVFVLWEQSIRRDLLSTRQYPNYRAVFDREALIQSDLKSRIDALATGRQNGIFSANDVRRKLEENAIPAQLGGDLYHMNGNMVPLTGAPVTPSSSVAPSLDAPAATEQVM
jgi:HK97 family phage portal protein